MLSETFAKFDREGASLSEKGALQSHLSACLQSLEQEAKHLPPPDLPQAVDVLGRISARSRRAEAGACAAPLSQDWRAALGAVSRRVSSLWGQVSSEELCAILRALRKSPLDHGELLEEAAARVRQLDASGALGPSHLAEAVAAYESVAAGGAVPNRAHLALLGALQHSVAASAPEMSASEALRAARPFVRWEHEGALQKAVRSLRRHVASEMRDLPMPQVAEAVSVFHRGRRGERRGSVAVLQAAQRCMMERAQEVGALPLQDVARLMRALAAAEFAPPPEAFAAAASRLSRLSEGGAPAPRPLDVANVAFGAAYLGHTGEELYSAAAALWRAACGRAGAGAGPAGAVCKMAWARAAAGHLDKAALMRLVGDLPSRAAGGELRPYHASMLFQADMAMGGRCLPPGLWAACRSAWAERRGEARPSHLQKVVRRALRRLGHEAAAEHALEDGSLSIDLAVVLPGGGRVAIEVDGPSHFTRSLPRQPLGRTLLRRRMLQAQGWTVVSVDSHDLDDMTSVGRRERLQSLLSGGLRECMSRSGSSPSPP